jgi:adenosyl cobinamide kinase/adenosyl cobinamide phosphate guanylyltransferase
MAMTIENFRGIEFVRISSMPKEQQEKVWNSFEKERIIKIIKDKALMNDCILYKDFTVWQSKQLSAAPQKSQSSQNSNSQVATLPIGKLAFE